MILRCRAVVADDNADAAIVGKVLDVPVVVEGQVTLVDLKKGGVVEVAAEIDATKRPLNNTRVITEDLDLHGPGNGNIGRLELHDGLGESEVIVDAGTGVGNVPGTASRRFGLIGQVVVDSSESEGLSSQTAAGDVAAHPVGTSWVAVVGVGLDEDVGSLADTKGDDLRVIGLDLDEVVSDDGEGVSVDGEALGTLGTGVDEAKTVGLAGLELELGDTGIVGALCVISGRNGGAVEVALAVD